MPVTPKEELNKLPPADSECSVCYADTEEDGIKLLRCTSCRNQFYCSVACQKKDWKKHKHNCSPLPVGELEYLPAVDAEKAQELTAEVQRVANVLHQWELAYDARRAEKGFNAAVLEQNADILKIELQPPYDQTSYTRLPPDHQTFKYRPIITLIARLFLIHLMTPSFSKSIEDVDALQQYLLQTQIPSTGGFAQLWGPKIACRPGDLSPGEYVQLAGMMQVLNIQEWFKSSGGKEGGGGQVEFGSVEEKAFARRLVDLALISKTLWNVK
ncbi:hypothetical protein EXIGLDRAFT_830040 [Exidia glandulosa HHB12029]|uniref:MYND-type domain-containing protein n=1 Tax=Exidia glandulosa HHB12029 TaxID=1314781 RepID=A0A165P373_EXIGL|nr:hypothetical protein EXIGLDRAFT_830040 [Exidia glandulosa HHB12029]